MNCACHSKPMYFNRDKRCKRGGFWECREKRRKRNALRVGICGTKVYMPDEDFKQFAIALRKERKEAQRGRTDD